LILNIEEPSSKAFFFLNLIENKYREKKVKRFFVEF